jgi:kinesin family protein 2/24
MQIYLDCVRPIVESAFLGARVTCFAYGQTGSGKTYTMNGDGRVAGLYVLGAQDIFHLRDQGKFRHLSISLSFYEIYCGRLHDLLNNRQELQLRVDAKERVNVIGLT